MRTIVLVAVLVLVPLSRADDTVPLFDGKTLDGWVIDGTKEFKDGATMKPCWEVIDGKIVCRGKGFGFLRYPREYSDFRLQVEYRLEPPDAALKRGRGNSGLGVRTGVYDPKRVDSRPSFAAYEVQLFDDPPGKQPDKHSNASLYRYVAPKLQATKAAPEWNRIEVECLGSRVKVILNGVEVIDVDQTTIPEIGKKPLKGFVCLQNHGSPVEFRKVAIRELPVKP